MSNSVAVILSRICLTDTIDRVKSVSKITADKHIKPVVDLSYQLSPQREGPRLLVNVHIRFMINGTQQRFRKKNRRTLGFIVHLSKEMAGIQHWPTAVWLAQCCPHVGELSYDLQSRLFNLAIGDWNQSRIRDACIRNVMGHCNVDKTRAFKHPFESKSPQIQSFFFFLISFYGFGDVSFNYFSFRSRLATVIITIPSFRFKATCK